jgi:hypothetical protein
MQLAKSCMVLRWLLTAKTAPRNCIRGSRTNRVHFKLINRVAKYDDIACRIMNTIAAV